MKSLWSCLATFFSPELNSCCIYQVYRFCLSTDCTFISDKGFKGLHHLSELHRARLWHFSLGTITSKIPVASSASPVPLLPMSPHSPVYPSLLQPTHTTVYHLWPARYNCVYCVWLRNVWFSGEVTGLLSVTELYQQNKSFFHLEQCVLGAAWTNTPVRQSEYREVQKPAFTANGCCIITDRKSENYQLSCIVWRKSAMVSHRWFLCIYDHAGDWSTLAYSRTLKRRRQQKKHNVERWSK